MIMSEFDPTKSINVIEFANSLKLPPPGNYPGQCYLDKMAQALEVIDYDMGLSSPEIREFHVIRWYCTDSHVGVKFFYYKDEFVAYSEQDGRKSAEVFSFVPTKVDILRKFLASLIPEKEFSAVNLIEEDETIPLFYQIGYSESLLHETCFLEDGNEYKVEAPKRGTRNRPGYGPDSDNMNLIVEKGNTKTRVHVGHVWFKTQLHP